jgi:hypothetical protein
MSNDSSNPDAAGNRSHLPFFRRTYLIDRSFQLKYTVILMCVGAAISLLFGALMYQANIDATELMDLPNPYRDAVYSHDKMQLWLVVGIAVIMAAAMGLFGVLVTHKVAGPIYVLSHYMATLSQGQYPQMRPLRKNDELKEFFERFRGAVEAMRVRDGEEGTALREAARKLETAATSGEMKAAIENITRIAQRKLTATQVGKA